MELAPWTVDNPTIAYIGTLALSTYLPRERDLKGFTGWSLRTGYHQHTKEWHGELEGSAIVMTIFVYFNSSALRN